MVHAPAVEPAADPVGYLALAGIADTSLHPVWNKGVIERPLESLLVPEIDFFEPGIEPVLLGGDQRDLVLVDFAIKRDVDLQLGRGLGTEVKHAVGAAGAGNILLQLPFADGVEE